MTSPRFHGDQRRVGLLFLTVVALWMARKWLNEVPGLEGLSDAGIVMAAALLLFVIPSGNGSPARLMQWDDVARLPLGGFNSLRWRSRPGSAGIWFRLGGMVGRVITPSCWIRNFGPCGRGGGSCRIDLTDQ